MTPKYSVRVCGAIMLNKSLDKCLLIKKKGTSPWGFPKGWKQTGEQHSECAVRVVLDKTGYDVREKIDLENKFERVLDGKLFRLFVAIDVPEDIPFEARTNSGISDHAWVNLLDLVAWLQSPPDDIKLWGVSQFMDQLMNYLEKLDAESTQLLRHYYAVHTTPRIPQSPLIHPSFSPLLYQTPISLAWLATALYGPVGAYRASRIIQDFGILQQGRRRTQGRQRFVSCPAMGSRAVIPLSPLSENAAPPNKCSLNPLAKPFVAQFSPTQKPAPAQAMTPPISDSSLHFKLPDSTSTPSINITASV